MEFNPAFQQRNDLLYSPFTRIAMGVEDIVDALQSAFLSFNEDNDTTQTAYRFAQALYAKCFFDLPKAKDREKEDTRKKYEKMVSEFTRECKLYESGGIPYEQFEPRFFDYYKEFIFMKSLAGFRIRRRENKDYSSDMAADIQDDLKEERKEDDYEETNDIADTKEL